MYSFSIKCTTLPCKLTISLYRQCINLIEKKLTSCTFKALLLIITSIQISHAETSRLIPATPIQIYDIAVKNDPALGAATSAHLISQEETRQVYGALQPEINFTAELARNREDVETDGIGVAGLTYFDSNNVQLKVKQPVYRKDIYTKIDIAKAESIVADTVFKIEQQTLIIRVIKAYFSVLSADDNLKFAKAEKQTTYQQLNNIKRKYKVGKSTPADLQKSQASYYLSVAQTLTAEDIHQDALEGLTQLTAMKYLTLAKLSKSYTPNSLEPEKLEYWVNLAESNNLKLQASRHYISTLKYKIDEQKSNHYPTLDLVAKYRLEDTGGRFGNSITNDKSIGFELAIPIYKGGQVRSKVKTAMHKLNEAKFNLLKIRREVIRETRKSFRAISTSLNRIRALKQAVISSESALALIKKGFKAGIRTNADVFDAKREIFKAKRDYLADKYSYTINYLQLKNLTGSLNRDELLNINKWFTIPKTL